MRLSKML